MDKSLPGWLQVLGYPKRIPLDKLEENGWVLISNNLDEPMAEGDTILILPDCLEVNHHNTYLEEDRPIRNNWNYRKFKEEFASKCYRHKLSPGPAGGEGRAIVQNHWFMLRDGEIVIGGDIATGAITPDLDEASLHPDYGHDVSLGHYVTCDGGPGGYGCGQWTCKDIKRKASAAAVWRKAAGFQTPARRLLGHKHFGKPLPLP